MDIEKMGRVCTTVGVILGTLNTCFQALLGFGNPLFRWLAWGLIAALFWLSTWLNKTRRTRLFDANDGVIEAPNTWRPISFLLAMVFTIVALGDVCISLARKPAVFNFAAAPSITHYGYTDASPDNVLVREGVTAIEVATQRSDFDQSPFSGSDIGTLIQKRADVGSLLLRSFIVRVVRFEPIPKYVRRPLWGRGPADKIDVAFYLSNRTGSPFPWVFSADYIRLNFNKLIRPDGLPYEIDDISPTGIRYFVNARDPGIYWIEPVIVVSAGIGPIKEIVFSRQPIAFGFTGSMDRDQITGDDTADEFNEADILSGRNSDWIIWPPMSERERQEHFDALQNFPDRPAIPMPQGGSQRGPG